MELYDIMPSAYLLDCIDLPNGFCTSNSKCLFGVDSMDDELGQFNQQVILLGDIFLKNFYTVFEAGDIPRV